MIVDLKVEVVYAIRMTLKTKGLKLLKTIV
jgi:hypothetical protein